jgi:hypothetical protein
VQCGAGDELTFFLFPFFCVCACDVIFNSIHGLVYDCNVPFIVSCLAVFKALPYRILDGENLVLLIMSSVGVLMAMKAVFMNASLQKEVFRMMMIASEVD